jgi:hypothetical protein
MYVNGNLVSSMTTTIRAFGALDPTQNPGLGIGNVQSATYNEWFDGFIDEVRISDQALSGNQLLVREPSTLSVLCGVGLVVLSGARVKRRSRGGARSALAHSDKSQAEQSQSRGLWYQSGEDRVP